MTRANAIATFGIAAALSGAAGAGCGRAASAPDNQDAIGSVSLGLTLSDNTVVDTVTFAISGNGIATINGTIDVTNSTSATALVGGIPAAPSPYTVAMGAVSTDQRTTCQGTAMFVVDAAQTVTASVTLQCHGAGQTMGGVAIGGRLDNCPSIQSFSASALEAEVGGSISLAVSASDADGDSLSFSWTAARDDIGTFGQTTAEVTSFTCTNAGSTNLSMSVSDGTCADARNAAIPITCIGNTNGGYEPLCSPILNNAGLDTGFDTCDDGSQRRRAALAACPTPQTFPTTTCGMSFDPNCTADSMTHAWSRPTAPARSTSASWSATGARA